MNSSMNQEGRSKYRDKDKSEFANDPNNIAPVDKIRSIAELIESKAQQKEELLNAKDGLNVEETIEVNDMYISAIKAKLALLEGHDY